MRASYHTQYPTLIPDPKSNCVQAYVGGLSFPSCEGKLPSKLLSLMYLRDGRRNGLNRTETSWRGQQQQRARAHRRARLRPLLTPQCAIG